MIEKTASVSWTGTGKAGRGAISTESGALAAYPYGFASRFADERRGSNPEELLAAAHAACFTMALSFACEKAGLTTRQIDTVARVFLDKHGDAFVIDRIALSVTANIPNVDVAQFQALAHATKLDCPLSKALAAVAHIDLDARLDSTAAS